MGKCVFSHMQTVNAWISCASVQSAQGLHCLLTDTTECISREQRIRWYFAQAQDDLNLCILRMSEGTVSLDVTHLILHYVILYNQTAHLSFQYPIISPYHVHIIKFFNPCSAEPRYIPCLCKQCRARSVGFWRSQLIWICTVCHSVCEFISTIWIKESDWLIIRSGCGIFV